MPNAPTRWCIRFSTSTHAGTWGRGGTGAASRFRWPGVAAQLSKADLPGPKQAEASAMPGDHGLRFGDDESRAPTGPDLGQPYPEKSIPGPFWPLHRTLSDAELVAQSEDSKLKGCTAAE